MKDHEIRELVNQIRDIAIEYHGTQQLRERIAHVIHAAMLQSGNSPVITDRWIPVSERMPEETEPFGGDLFSPDVLTQNQDGDMHVCCTQWGKWIHKKFPGDVITHWQNLPPEAREVKDE